MFQAIKNWLNSKRYANAVRVVNNHGFAVVKLSHSAGSTYIEKNDGSLWRINKVIPELKGRKK